MQRCQLLERRLDLDNSASCSSCILICHFKRKPSESCQKCRPKRCQKLVKTLSSGNDTAIFTVTGKSQRRFIRLIKLRSYENFLKTRPMFILECWKFRPVSPIMNSFRKRPNHSCSWMESISLAAQLFNGSCFYSRPEKRLEVRSCKLFAATNFCRVYFVSPQLTAPGSPRMEDPKTTNRIRSTGRVIQPYMGEVVWDRYSRQALPYTK